MRCWMQLRLALVCTLPALMLAACGSGAEAPPPAPVPAHEQPADPTNPAVPLLPPDGTPTSAPSAERAPRLISAPSASQAALQSGETLQVWLAARGQRPLAGVTVTLRDPRGRRAGEGGLTPLDETTWAGLVPVAPDAQAGDYAMEVTLNDGPFVSGEALHQALYRFDVGLSTRYYRLAANYIEIQGEVFTVQPLGDAVSAVPLSSVTVQRP